MWGVTPTDLWDWASLKARIAQHGIRNSLLLAPMPTASTAQILGNNESIEAYTSNIYVRRVLSGEFQVCKIYWMFCRLSWTYLYILSYWQVVNHHLLRDLTEIGLWNKEMKNKIIANNGSVQVSHLWVALNGQPTSVMWHEVALGSEIENSVRSQRLK